VVLVDQVEVVLVEVLVMLELLVLLTQVAVVEQVEAEADLQVLVHNQEQMVVQVL
jgi:hypothetical protein